MKTPTPKELIGRIDFEKLKAQKIILLELHSKLTSNDYEWLALDGILTLIDSIQDCAVDRMKFDESHVFNLSGNDNHMDLDDAIELVTKDVSPAN